MSGSLFSRLERRFGDPAEQLTRRELLKAALAGGAGLLLSNSVTRAAAPRSREAQIADGRRGIGKPTEDRHPVMFETAHGAATRAMPDRGSGGPETTLCVCQRHCHVPVIQANQTSCK